MRDNGDEADGTPKPANPLLYPHLYLDLPQTSSVQVPVQTTNTQVSTSAAPQEPVAAHSGFQDDLHVPDPPRAQLLNNIKTAITNAISRGISLSEILQYIYNTFPIVINIPD